MAGEGSCHGFVLRRGELTAKAWVERQIIFHISSVAGREMVWREKGRATGWFGTQRCNAIENE